MADPERDDRFFHVILEDGRGRRTGMTVNAEDEAKAMDIAEDRAMATLSDPKIKAVLVERI